MQMNQNIKFNYNYSAKENKEVLEIRNKYLPRQESKLEELKRLDLAVQTAGITEALSVGIIGTLIFGIGMCLGMQVIAKGSIAVATGIIIGFAGAGAAMSAFPIYRKVHEKTKARYAPRILELSSQLLNEKDQAF